MASFHTFIHKQESSAAANDALTVDVTTALCQFNSKQDVKPTFKASDTHVALLAGDGHSGYDTCNCLTDNGVAILEETLTNGVESGMAMSQDLCKDFEDGAMLVIARYEFSSRKIRIISVGDASCSVYQQNQLVHQQPHQDAETFMNAFPQGICTGKNLQGEDYGTIEVKRVNYGNNTGRVQTAGKMTPAPDGLTMGFPQKPSYLRFRVEVDGKEKILAHWFASGGFVGHKGYPRLAPCVTEFVIAPGPFHVIMTSDGVSDVMHPKDALMRDGNVTALRILDESKNRWTRGWLCNGYPNVKPSPVETVFSSDGKRIQSFQKTQQGTYKVTFYDGKQRTVTSIDETNQGADDISVLVYKGL